MESDRPSSSRPPAARPRSALRIPDPALFGATAVAVGLSSAGGVWCFKRLIDLAQTVAVGHAGPFDDVAPWGRFVAPVVGGLVVGLLLKFLIGHERHHGVAGIMEAVAVGGGRLRWRRAPAKTVAAALSIGAGASVGPEDPSVQIGANLGSFAGEIGRFSSDRVRTLVAAGAAAGIAAAFNAPIAGLFFALEIILGDLGGAAFGAVVIASVASAVLTQALSGTQPAFDVPPYALNSPWELPLYLGLGVLAGPVAAFYVRAIHGAKDAFAATRLPTWTRPAIAGLAVGAVALALPQVMGVGYGTIERVLGGAQVGAGLLVAILVAKLLLTGVCVGAGFPGGVFAPSLVLGAALGGAYALAARAVLPIEVDAPAFAMVGMAAVLAGAVRAPLTASLLLFEMTRDYRILLPLLFAVAVALYVSKRLQPDSVYEVALARRGVRLEHGRDVEVLEGVTVAETMQTDPPTISVDENLARATDVFARSRQHGLPVIDAAGRLAGILTVQDVDRAHAAGARDEATIGDFCTHDLVVAHPDESIGAALRRMGGRDIGRLPVVARDDPTRLVGLLRRTDLVRAYDAALTRRAAARHRLDQARLGALSGATVEEFEVAAGSAAAEHAVRDVPWPRGAAVASVRRGAEVVVPRGDTVLRKGDVLVAVVESGAAAEVGRLCAAPPRAA